MILKRGYAITARQLAPAGTPIGRKVADTIDALAREIVLVQLEKLDRVVTIPPTLRARARVVRGTALEVWYTRGADHVTIYAVKIIGS